MRLAFEEHDLPCALGLTDPDNKKCTTLGAELERDKADRRYAE